VVKVVEQEKVEVDAMVEEVVVVVVVVLGVLLVAVVLGELEVVTSVDVVLEAGVDVDVEGTVVVLVVGGVVEDDDPLDRAKYAAAPATAITTTMITARKAVAMPREEACK